MTFWRAWLPVHIVLWCMVIAESKKKLGKSDTTPASNFQPDDSFEWHFVVPATAGPILAHPKTTSSTTHKAKETNMFGSPQIADPGLSLVWNSPPYLEGLDPLTSTGLSSQDVSSQQPKRKKGTRYESKTKISLSEYESHEEGTELPPVEVSDEDDGEYDTSTDDYEELTTISTTTTTTSTPKPQPVNSVSGDRLVLPTKGPKLKAAANSKSSAKRVLTTTTTTLTPSTVRPNTPVKFPIIRKPVAIIRDQSKLIKQQVDTTTQKIPKKIRPQGRAVKQRTESTKRPAVQKVISYKPEVVNEKIVQHTASTSDDIDWENTPLKVPQGDFGMRLKKRETKNDHTNIYIFMPDDQHHLGPVSHPQYTEKNENWKHGQDGTQFGVDNTGYCCDNPEQHVAQHHLESFSHPQHTMQNENWKHNPVVQNQAQLGMGNTGNIHNPEQHVTQPLRRNAQTISHAQTHLVGQLHGTELPSAKQTYYNTVQPHHYLYRGQGSNPFFHYQPLGTGGFYMKPRSIRYVHDNTASSSQHSPLHRGQFLNSFKFNPWYWRSMGK